VSRGRQEINKMARPQTRQTQPRNALRQHMDGLRARDPAMAEVSQLDQNAETTAIALREILREARKASGLTMQQMADRLHVTQPTVSAIENGDGNLGVKTLARYLGALDMDLMQLVTDIRQSVLANTPVAQEAEDISDTSDGDPSAPPAAAAASTSKS
jgi:transcriptional regulator with XRE-family HTH domain